MDAYSIFRSIFNTSILARIIPVLFIFYISLHAWKNRKFYQMLKAFESPPMLPIIGNLHLVFSSTKNRYNKLISMVQKCQSPFVCWLSYIPFVVIADYEDIQIVSNKSHMRYALGIFKNIVGDSIALSHPDKWRNIRRLMNPAFSPSMLQQYLTVFNEQSQILCTKLSKVSNTGEVIDLWQYMADLNVDIITENMAGIQLQVQEKGGNEFSDSLTKAMKLESSRLISPWILLDFPYNLYLLFTGNNGLFKTLRKLPTKVVQTKRQEYQMLKLNNHKNVIDKSIKTFIDTLIRIHDANSSFTEQQMNDEVLTMIAAGSESTAITSCFILLMLAIFQDAQEKVYQEILTVFKTTNIERIRMEDLYKMKYLEQCIKETLRKFTLSPIMFRKATEDITLSNGKIIPTGAMIALAYHLVHINPEIYPNADSWDPEHFGSENGKAQFVPFGTGARACIGSKYAIISLKTQVIYILGRYRLATDVKLEDVEIDMDVLIRKKNGYPVLVTKRSNEE